MTATAAAEPTPAKRNVLLEKAGSGCIVAFRIPMDVASALALPGGLPPEELHLTLTYHGAAADIDADTYRRILSAVQGLAARWSPIHARVGGVGRFSGQMTSDGMDAFYASVDGPALPAFREALVSELMYGADVPVSAEHGFTPHITLMQLLPSAPSPVEHVPALPITFTSVEVYHAGAIAGFPLLGPAVEKSADPISEALQARAEKDWAENWSDLLTLSAKPQRFAVTRRGGRVSYFYESPKAGGAWGFRLDAELPPVVGGYAPASVCGVRPIWKFSEDIAAAQRGIAGSPTITCGTYRTLCAADGHIEVIHHTVEGSLRDDVALKNGAMFSGRHVFSKRDGSWRLDRPVAQASLVQQLGKTAAVEALAKAGGRTCIMPKDPVNLSAGYVRLRLPDLSKRRIGLRSILKAADEKRYTLGVAYPCNQVDVHGDMIDADEIEKAAWDYIENRRVGLMHRFGTEGRGRVVESYIHRGPPYTMSGETVSTGDWLLGVVWDEVAWAAIKSGDITGFSMQGWAERESE